MRVTKSDLKKVFGSFCKLMNKEIGHERGNFNLDYVPEYGGYKIVEQMYTEGRDVFGYDRLSLSEMYKALILANRAMEYKNSHDSEEKGTN